MQISKIKRYFLDFFFFFRSSCRQVVSVFSVVHISLKKSSDVLDSESQETFPVGHMRNPNGEWTDRIILLHHIYVRPFWLSECCGYIYPLYGALDPHNGTKTRGTILTSHVFTAQSHRLPSVKTMFTTEGTEEQLTSFTLTPQTLCLKQKRIHGLTDTYECLRILGPF